MMKIFLVCFLLFVSLVCGGGALRALEENENSVMTVPAGLAAIWADEEPETANWEERVGLEFSSWDGVAGTSIANFLKSGDFYRAPNSSEIFYCSELPYSGNSAVRGMRLRGLLVIPADGDLQLCVPAPEPEDLEDLGVPRVWLEACGLVQDGVPAAPGVVYGYNQLGQQISIFDARGARTLTYDANHRLASETDPATGTAVALAYDSFGRVSQKTLLRGNESLAQFSRSYDASGRISSAGMDGTEIADYGYLPGTPLPASQTLGNGVEKNVSYEQSRNLPTALTYSKDAVQIAGRAYAYNVLGQVTARVQTRGNAVSRNDAFGYNARGELVSATLGSAAYAYDFDAIGNRVSAEEAGTSLAYATNALNQYSGIVASPLTFAPSYDVDGNQTLIRTSTGMWHVVYNAESRPVRFENIATQTVVECGYDSQGRRFEKKVTVAGTVVLHERYVYDGYLQIAAFDVSTDASGTESPSLKRSVLWDPAEATATRPLAVKNVGESGNTALYYCTHDLTKNVCELLDGNGDVVVSYDYAPFGAVTAGTPADAVAPANPFQWSSEVYDSELDLVYYNYRHYSPSDGRWLSRDPIEEQGGWNLYAFVGGRPISSADFNGLWGAGDHSDFVGSALDNFFSKNKRLSLKCQKNIKEILVSSNNNQDGIANGNLFNNLFHFNRDVAEEGDADGEVAEELIKAYKKYLNGLAEKVKASKKGSCKEGLEALGAMSHAWQDFYSHAIGSPDFKWQEKFGRPGYWNRPTPDNIYGVWPSSYPGEHPRFSEINFSEEEWKLRYQDAQDFTFAKFADLLPAWLKGCKCECGDL
ncbi:MAG: RHS repeat domain-containing protein [Candidatus Spyradosoma sp.]